MWLHGWELGKKGVFDKIFCSLLTKAAPEYMGNSLKIFPHLPSTQPCSWWHAGMCNFSVCFFPLQHGEGNRGRSAEGFATRGEGTSPLLSFCARLHQEENGLLGYAFRDYLIRSSTERLCLTVLNEDLVNLWFAEGDWRLIYLY